MAWEFLAFAWSAADKPAGTEARDLALRLAAASWLRAWRSEGLEVWTPAARPAPACFRGAEGALLVGRFHERARALSATEQAAGWAGRLSAAGWGAYAALAGDAPSGRAEVFRDPSGALDVLTWRCGRLNVVASDVVDLPFGVMPDRWGLDWDVIAQWVRRPLSVTDRCGVAGLNALAPGVLRRIDAEGRWTDRPVWRPADWAPDPAAGAESPDRDWAPELRRTACEVTHQALAGRERVLVQVSGGFDSSLVVNLAAQTGTQVFAATFYGDRPEGDERCWARAACAPAGVPLHELAKTLQPLTEADFALSARSARPSLNALDAQQDRQTAELLRTLGASALLTGQGGDPVFYQMPSPGPVADLRQARGVLALFDPFTAAWARELRRSVWSAWREADAGGGGAGAGPMAGLLGPRAALAPDPPAHPWLTDLADAPPGKRFQIENLAGAQMSWGRARRTVAAELVQTLLAQPLVELALSIPSWRLLEGGRERGLARRAFADTVPPVILQRRAKGNLTSFYTRLVAASLPTLRPHLLDGVLVDAGVLDCAAVEAALYEDRLLWTGEGLRLLSAAVVESWVRYWQTQAADAPRVGRRRGVGSAWTAAAGLVG